MKKTLSKTRVVEPHYSDVVLDDLVNKWDTLSEERRVNSFGHIGISSESERIDRAVRATLKRVDGAVHISLSGDFGGGSWLQNCVKPKAGDPDYPESGRTWHLVKNAATLAPCALRRRSNASAEMV